ncbi:MAG TPA: hypothetical protein VFR97_07060 [Capillimicrobium sp.]|nr:hypothetical protein [Capillimicrobium sp.]
MRDVVVTVAYAAAAINLAAALWGGWRWWKVEPSGAFWVMLRGGQVAAAAFALLAGIAALAGHRPDDSLFWLYVALPLGVAFVAEQLRILSAQTVLDARGLEDARAVGRLPDADQRSVVLAIVRREMGVMAAEAAAVAFLLARAAMTSGGV